MSAIQTVFTLRIGDKNAKTAEIVYNPIAYLTPANITQVEIESEANDEVVEFGEEPEIIPLGMKGCSAMVVGTFSDAEPDLSKNRGNARITPVVRTAHEAGLCPECLLEDTVTLFDKVSGKEKTFAVTLDTGHNKGGCRELQGGIWRIDKFSWDRKAKEMGIYRFSMTLGYVWVTKEEQMIFAPGTGDKVPTTSMFEIDVSPGGNNGQVAVTALEIKNPIISKSLMKLNTLTFKHKDYIKADSIVALHKRGAENVPGNPDRYIFYGVVTSSEQDKNAECSITCNEIAEILYRGVATQPSDWINFLLLKIIMRNPKANGLFYKIKEMLMELILTYYTCPAGFTYHPGTGVDRTPAAGDGLKAGDRENLPGPGREKVKLGTQTFSCLSVGKCINQLLYKECGLYIWYDYRNEKTVGTKLNPIISRGTLEYGFVRDKLKLDISKEIIVSNQVKNSPNDDFKPDGVIVWSADGEYFGYAGDVGNGKNILVYTYNDSRSDLAYAAIAHSILEMNTLLDTRTYLMKFPPGTVRFREGDYFDGIGDSTVARSGATLDANMVYRKGDDLDPFADPGDTVWQIKEITIREDYTEVLVGPSYYSITDLYRDTLNRTKDGVPMPIDTVTLNFAKKQIGGPSSDWK